MMKKIVWCMVLLPTFVSAQKLELGIGAGASVSTSPSDNMPFKTDRMVVSYAASLTGLFNINEHLQTGITLHVNQLSGKSSVAYQNFYGQPVGGDGKKIVYARQAYSLCAVVNGRRFTGNGYIYGGVAGGFAAARHDSKTLKENETYRAPNGGNGWSLGLQLGYVAGITKRIALSAEAAMRYYNLRYNALHPLGKSEQLHYGIMAFPVTVGLRYRLFTSETREKELQDLMN